MKLYHAASLVIKQPDVYHSREQDTKKERIIPLHLKESP